MSPHDLDKYYREVAIHIKVVKSNYDPTSTLKPGILRPIGSPTMMTRVSGLVRKNGIVLDVRETFNNAVERNEVDKVYRYTFLNRGTEILRMETQAGYPEHAHFPPRYISGGGRHFNINRWPPELQDMNFLKAFQLFTEIERAGGILPEPFRSA